MSLLNAFLDVRQGNTKAHSGLLDPATTSPRFQRIVTTIHPLLDSRLDLKVIPRDRLNLANHQPHLLYTMYYIWFLIGSKFPRGNSLGFPGGIVFLAYRRSKKFGVLFAADRFVFLHNSDSLIFDLGGKSKCLAPIFSVAEYPRCLHRRRLHPRLPRPCQSFTLCFPRLPPFRFRRFFV